MPADLQYYMMHVLRPQPMQDGIALILTFYVTFQVVWPHNPYSWVQR